MSVTEPAMPRMAFAHESLVPFMGPPKYGGSARLLGRRNGVDPRRISLGTERGSDEHVWELPALGLEAPRLDLGLSWVG
jgi:hypothetical protein